MENIVTLDAIDHSLSDIEFKILLSLDAHLKNGQISLYKFLELINQSFGINNAYYYVLKLVNNDLVHLNVDVHDARVFYPSLSLVGKNLIKD